MDQLVKIISEKAGITEEQSRTAVAEVVKYVKGYLPPQMSGYVDTFLGGGTPSTPSTSPGTPANAAGGIDDLVRGVGDMYGSPAGTSSDTTTTNTPGSSGSASGPKAV
jgi:hypothetical protein